MLILHHLKVYFIDDKIKQDPNFKVLQEKFKEGKCIYWDAEYTSEQQYLYGFYHEDEDTNTYGKMIMSQDYVKEFLIFFQNIQIMFSFTMLLTKVNSQKLLEKMKCPIQRIFLI